MQALALGRIPILGRRGARPELLYGCVKPTTTSTLDNFRIEGGTHDVTYSRVRFTGDVTGVGSHSTTGIRVSSSHPGDVYNITFDRCVFETDDYEGGSSNAFHAILTQNVVHHIVFDHCWFEPASRICFEFNGRGGWWHDVLLDHCTFEASCGQQFSCDMSPGDYTPTSPYGVNVDGVVRGVEGLRITNCLFEGTGATVAGFEPGSYKMGLEFGCVYPYASDESIGRSVFLNNKVGRCLSAWLNFSYKAKGQRYMTFQNNLFDYAYNPHGSAASNDAPWSSGANLNYCSFIGNKWVLGTANNQPWDFVASGSPAGGHNTFVDEHWTKPSGTIGGACAMPFTDSTYTRCRFELPKAVTFPESATGTDCYFANGSSGGSFS